MPVPISSHVPEKFILFISIVFFVMILADISLVQTGYIPSRINIISENNPVIWHDVLRYQQGIDNILSVARYHSLANFASALQTIFSGITAIIIFFITGNKHKCWLVTGLFFIYMGINDGTNFYKPAGDTIRFLFNVNYIPLFNNMSLFSGLMTFFILYFFRHELKVMKLRKNIYIALICFTCSLLTDLLVSERTLSVIENITGLTNIKSLYYIFFIMYILYISGNISLFYVFLKYLFNILYNREVIFRLNKIDNGEKTDKMIEVYTEKLVVKIIYLCLIIEIFLILLDICTFALYIPVRTLRYICYMTYECSFANFISSFYSFLTGLIAIIIFFMLRFDKAGKRRVTVWFITGIFFIYIGLDDGVSFHEEISYVLKPVCQKYAVPFFNTLFEIYPSYYWQFILGPFFSVMFLYLFYFLWYELKGLSLKRYIFIALLCLANALFLDYILGSEQCILILQYKTGLLSYDLIRHCLKLAGESLELLGIICFLYVFFKYLAHILDNK
ncbi:MAG: hypothetical protein ABRQ39_18145, partial [Candidatus Eremiobacterota bacterium]